MTSGTGSSTDLLELLLVLLVTGRRDDVDDLFLDDEPERVERIERVSSSYFFFLSLLLLGAKKFM